MFKTYRTNLKKSTNMTQAPSFLRPMHPAEQRLKILLPSILEIANERVLTALNTLKGEEKSMSKSSLIAIELFIGNKSEKSIINLRHRFKSIQSILEILTPENINIVYSKLNNPSAYAWVSGEDIKRFQDEHSVTINMSYINLATLHPEAIAKTVIHEVTHLALNTKDYIYAYSGYFSKESLYKDVSLLSLYDYALKPGTKPLENADTLANLVVTLDYDFRKAPILLKSSGHFAFFFLEYKNFPINPSSHNMAELELASATSGKRKIHGK